MKYRAGDLIICTRDGDYGIILSADERGCEYWYFIHWTQDGTHGFYADSIDEDTLLFKLVARQER